MPRSGRGGRECGLGNAQDVGRILSIVMSSPPPSQTDQAQQQALLLHDDELSDRDGTRSAETVSSLTDDGAAHGYLLRWPGTVVFSHAMTRGRMAQGRVPVCRMGHL